MTNHLENIAASYDKAIDFGRKGIDLYNHLPEHITSHPDYPAFEKLRDEGHLSDSARKEVKEYLTPKTDMNFIDLGCCLNLMFGGYDKWLSTYHGVDISSKTIELLNEYVKKNNIHIGSLFCGSIHETPYEDSSFDIAACIGILEYFEKDFVEEAIKEAYRIIKSDGKFVLDIPNFNSPIFTITKLLEDYMGRTDLFNMTARDFEHMLKDYFVIIKIEEVAGMIQYFLRSRK